MMSFNARKALCRKQRLQLERGQSPPALPPFALGPARGQGGPDAAGRFAAYAGDPGQEDTRLVQSRQCALGIARGDQGCMAKSDILDSVPGSEEDPEFPPSNMRDA